MTGRNGDAPQTDPIKPLSSAPDTERLRYCEAVLQIGIAEQQRMSAAIDALATDTSAIAVDVDEIKGVLLRVESIVLTTAAKQANHERESAPPTLDRLAELRTSHERQARALEKRAIRVDERISDLDRRVGTVEGDVRETAKHATVTAERAIEVLVDQRDSLVDEVEAKQEKRAASTSAARTNRGARYFALALVVWTALVGAAASKLGGCARPALVPAMGEMHR